MLIPRRFLLLLFVLFCGGRTAEAQNRSAACKAWTTKEIPLQAKRQTVRHHMAIAPVAKAQIIAGKGFVAFVGPRAVWVKIGKSPATPLQQHIKLPDDVDYFQAAVADDALRISVASYPQTQQAKESKLSPAAFIRGPQDKGVVTIRFAPASIEHTPNWPVSSAPPGLDLAEPELQRYEGNIHAWFRTPQALYAAADGAILRFDKKGQAAYLWAEEMYTGFDALFVEGQDIWVSAQNENVNAIWRLRGSDIETFDLGHPQEWLYTNTILRWRQKLLTASLAGLVQIDESRCRYVHFTTSKDKTQRRIYGLVELGGELWAAREDGYIRFDLAKRQATIFSLRGVSNNAFAIGSYRGGLLVSTDEKVWGMPTQARRH